LQYILQDAVAYTGTHDNDTTKGWFNCLNKDDKKYILQTLRLHGHDGDNDQIAEDSADNVLEKLIDDAMYSEASLCMLPMQDCLHLGSAARMNTPGTTHGNWQWSFSWEQINDNIATDLRLRIEQAGRLVEHDG